MEWDGRWFHCLRQGAEQQDRVWQPGRVPLPSQKQSSQGTPGAAAALGIRHLPGNWYRTLALKWGLLPNCTTRRWLTHPLGNGEDMRYCGQNRGFLAVVPAADCFDGLNAILLSLFFFFLFAERFSFLWGQSFRTKVTRAISLSPTEWLWLLQCLARQCSLPSMCGPF